MKQLITFTIALLFCLSLASATNCCFGDTDGDCIFTGFDLMNINQYLLNKPVDSYCGMLNADVDGDGVLTALDKIQLERYVLSKAPTITLAHNIGEPIDNSPIIRAVSPISFDQGITYTLPAILDDYVIDKDNLPSEITWTADNQNIIIELDENRKVTLSAVEGWAGTETFTVKAIDPDGNFDSTTLTVTVNEIKVYPDPEPTPTESSDSDSDTGSPNCKYEHFECSEWTECQGHFKTGSQSRTCEKDKTCRGDYHPTELKSCDLIFSSTQETEQEENQETQNIDLQEQLVPTNFTTRAIQFVRENPNKSITVATLFLMSIIAFLVYTFVLK